MTEVSYEPRKRVIIHEYSCYDSVEELIRGAFSGAPPGATVGPVRWVDGVALIPKAYPMTEAIVKELIEGRLHWDHVSFAPMEEYKRNIHVEDMRVTAEVINVSVNPTFRVIAKFIKEKLMRKTDS